MKSLQEDLQTPKQNLDEFADVTKRVLDYLPNIVSERVETRDYTILSSVVAGTTKFARLGLKVFILLILPPITKGSPYNKHISPFSKFIADDIGKLLAS